MRDGAARWLSRLRRLDRRPDRVELAVARVEIDLLVVHEHRRRPLDAAILPVAAVGFEYRRVRVVFGGRAHRIGWSVDLVRQVREHVHRVRSLLLERERGVLEEGRVADLVLDSAGGSGDGPRPLIVDRDGEVVVLVADAPGVDELRDDVGVDVQMEVPTVWTREVLVGGDGDRRLRVALHRRRERFDRLTGGLGRITEAETAGDRTGR